MERDKIRPGMTIRVRDRFEVEGRTIRVTATRWDKKALVVDGYPAPEQLRAGADPAQPCSVMVWETTKITEVSGW